MTRRVLDGSLRNAARECVRGVFATTLHPASRWARRGRSLLGALLVALLFWYLGRAFVLVAIRNRAPSALVASATWGLLLLANFCGWGSAINLALFPRRRADWGLRCAWGWAATVAVGGALCALSMAKRTGLVSLAAIGLAMFFFVIARGYVRWSRRSNWRRERRAWSAAPFAAAVAAIGLLASTQYLSSVKSLVLNGNDDQICYFAFATEILDRGTLTQPFSLRRLSAYGAKSLLDALQLAIPVPVHHLRLVDGGLALASVMALIVGQVRLAGWAGRAIALLALLLTVTIPDIRFNTATTLTGVVFFLGLYRTVGWVAIRGPGGWRAAVPVALIAAGAGALRQNYLVPIGVFLALSYGIPILRAGYPGRFHTIRPAIVDAAAALALVVLFLAPWWALSFRWCNTFLFPLVKGNFNREYPIFAPLGRFEQVRYLWQNMTYSLPVKAVPLFLVAGLTLSARPGSSTLNYFVLAAFVGFVVLVVSVPDSDSENLGRYYFGFTFPAVLAIVLAAAYPVGRARDDIRARAGRTVAIPLVVCGLALQLYGDREETARRYDGYLATLQPEYEKPEPWVATVPDPTYAKLQYAVPAGAPIVVMVDEAYRFDFRRNPIEILDIVGAASPKPGLPLLEGAGAVAEYLVSRGYDYAIVVHPDAAGQLYRRDEWNRNKETGIPIWKRTAPFYLAAFDAFDELRATRVHYADVASMTTLDLRMRSR